MPAEAPASLDARASVGLVMTKFGAHKYIRDGFLDYLD